VWRCRLRSRTAVTACMPFENTRAQRSRRNAADFVASSSSLFFVLHDDRQSRRQFHTPHCNVTQYVATQSTTPEVAETGRHKPGDAHPQRPCSPATQNNYAIPNKATAFSTRAARRSTISTYAFHSVSQRVLSYEISCYRND